MIPIRLHIDDQQVNVRDVGDTDRVRQVPIPREGDHLRYHARKYRVLEVEWVAAEAVMLEVNVYTERAR